MADEIWDYTFNRTGLQDVEMQDGAVIKFAQNFGNEICMWAMVDPVAGTITRQFQVFDSHEDIPDIVDTSKNYIGTVYFGTFVGHVFEYVAD